MESAIVRPSPSAILYSPSSHSPPRTVGKCIVDQHERTPAPRLRRTPARLARPCLPRSVAMERPIMNPSFLDDAPPLVEGPPWWARLLSLVGRTLRLVFVDFLARRLVPRCAASTSTRP